MIYLSTFFGVAFGFFLGRMEGRKWMRNAIRSHDSANEILRRAIAARKEAALMWDETSRDIDEKILATRTLQ